MRGWSPVSRGGRRKRAHSTGLKTIATSSEASSVMITVMGRYFMNSPMMPGQKMSGANATTVVSVEDVTAPATWSVPSAAAVSASLPSPRWR
jgi:hypothetical protein